jgi:hypothetical protein
MWLQCWDLYGPRGLETKRPKEPEPRGPEKGDLRGLKSHPTKKNRKYLSSKYVRACNSSI